MAKIASIVQINGSRYNTVTGNVIGTVKRIATPSNSEAGNQVIDGFTKQKNTRKKSTASSAAQRSKIVTKKNFGKSPRSIKSSAKNVHHRREHSKTLVRTMVVRPTLRLKEATANLAQAARPSLKTIDQDRQSRAKLIGKSSKVSRFGVYSSKKDETSKTVAKEDEVVSTSAKVSKLSAKASVGAPLPSMVTSASHQRLERILDEALLGADAHKQALKRGRHNPLGKLFDIPRWLGLLLIFVAAVLIAVLFAWRTVPAVAVKLAAIRSHVSANVPSYTPSGFGFSKVMSKPGAVSIKYQDKATGADSYTVTQTNSSWDSSSLVANTINKNEAVQTSQVGGTTVYIYGSSDNAAWVNNGALYKIANNAHLSSDQILHIAQGL